MLVASRRNPHYPNLHDQLVAPHERLMATLLHTAIESIDLIHALLLLCLWPVTKLRESYDPGWTYIGIAVQAATQMDLHFPSQTGGLTRPWKGWGDFKSGDLSMTTRIRTWMGCFGVGVR